MKKPAWVAVAALLAAAASAGVRVPKAVVPGVRAEVAPVIERHVAEARKKVMGKLALGGRVAANCRVPVRVKAFADPWGGLAQLEAHGLKVAEAARGGVAALPAVLDALSASVGKPAGETVEAPKRPPSSLEEHVEHLVWVLDRAKALRDEATAKLPKDADRFLVVWPTRMLRHWGPQMPLNEQTRQILHNDRAFHTLAFTVLRWDKMVGSAKLLSSLAREAHVASLAKALAGARPLGEPVEGVTGDLLVKKDTPHGLILVGGKGPNTYELKVPVALLIDLGGDDTYKGMVASTSGRAHPNSLAIDVAGDDVYTGQALGLATGRLGVGMLVDLAGNDRYQLGAGACGGAGLGGIGVLCDAAGDDVYTGSRFTQGVAFGGIGLLLDLGGNDRYVTSSGLGRTTRDGFAVFLDKAGKDDYTGARSKGKTPPADGQTHANDAGGLFVDKE